MEEVFNIVVNELEALKLEFWPVGGTMIGALRYGRIAGNLTNGKKDVIDDDLEFIVALDRED